MMLMFVATLAMGVHTFSFAFPSLLASLVYLHNVIFASPSYISVVAWSLEIEIQFYLMAPLLFRVLTLPKAFRRMILATTAVCMVNLQQNYHPAVDSIYNHIQFFLVGILLADLHVSGTFSFLKNKWAAFAAPVFLAAVLLLPIKDYYHARLVYPFFILGLYILVLTNDWVKSVFSYKFIPIIGGMCYSIYLLHYPLISYFGRFTTAIKLSDYYFPNLLLQLAVLAIPIVTISGAFYFFIERPFMSSKWMDKLLKKRADETPEEVHTPMVQPEPVVKNLS
jgi:peptidoglycan/LPS O-acetylase OafA/YrhL